MNNENKKLKALENKMNMFFSEVVSVIAFGLGISCLGTEHSSRNAIISLIFLGAFMWGVSKYNKVSVEFKKIRAKENKSKEEGKFITELDYELSSWRIIKFGLSKVPAFVISTVFLVIIASGII